VKLKLRWKKQIIYRILLKDSTRRLKSNIAQRLKKIDIEKKKAAKVKHVKWEHNLNVIAL